MSHTYDGNAAAVTPHLAVAIAAHDDTDALNAANANAPLLTLANVLAFLQQYAPVMGAGVANAGPLEIAGNLTIGGQATINSALAVTGEVDHSNRLKSGAPINATDLKLVSEHPGFGVGAGSVRRYVSGAGSTLTLYEVVNAISEGGVWTREVANHPATMIQLTEAGMRVVAWPVGDATAFERNVRTTSAGLTWGGVGTTAADANPPASTPLTNQLRAANVCKAWGALQFVGSASPDQFNVLDGSNVGDFSVSPLNGNVFRVSFPVGGEMASANYSVPGTVVGVLTTGAAFFQVLQKDAAWFDFAIFDHAGTQYGPLGSDDLTVDFTVFGKQTS